MDMKQYIQSLFLWLSFMSVVTFSTPTPPPTPTPTINCNLSGYFVSSDSGACSVCPIGRYSSISSPPFPASCSLCPAGQYNAVTGQSECIQCASGRLSSSDGSSCNKDCEVGEYSYNDTSCVECDLGKYAPQPLSGSCLECGPGYYTDNETAATTCTKCDIGRYSNASSVTCEKCEPGKFSSSGSSQCTSCIEGFHAPISGSSVCTACEAGKYAPDTETINCTACSLGKFQASSGQSSCQSCEKGKYSPTLGSTSCLNCPSTYSSAIGSSTCSLAAEGYLLKASRQASNQDNTLRIITCPHHSVCIGGSTPFPVPEKGYWIDRLHVSHASQVYKCTRDTCLGGDTNSSCWYDENMFNKSECNSNEIQCRKGARGPLCGSCYNNFRYNSVTNDCQHCKKAELSVQLSFVVVICFVLIVPLLLHYGHLLSEKLKLRQTSTYQFICHFDSGTLKVIYSTYQILVSATFSLDIVFPESFSNMMTFISIFSLEFMSMDCIGAGRNAYYDTVYLWCIAPIAAGFMIVVVGFIRIKLVQHFHDHFHPPPAIDGTLDDDENFFSPRVSNSNRSNPWSVVRKNITMRVKDSKNGIEHQIAKIKNSHMWLFLLLGYLVLPAVTSRQLQVFDCYKFSSGKSYLKADTHIDCKDKEYLEFRLVIIIFLCLYQLIPIFWYFLLLQKQDLLHPSNFDDEHHAQFARNHNPRLASLRFLFGDYKCSKWWFEIMEVYRRIVFLGVLPLVSHRPDIRASFGCILAVMSVGYFREEQPYRIDSTNVISHTAQYAILITFYGALSIESNAMINFGLRGERLGIFLICSNMVIVLLALRYAWNRFRRDQMLELHKESQAIKNEDARNFSKEKFKTTFDYIWRQSVPASHALCYYYTTREHAKRCRKSGIPAHKRFQGVPLSLRTPFETTESELDIFNSNYKKKPPSFPDLEKEPEEPPPPTRPMRRFSDRRKIPPIIPDRHEFPNEEVLVVSLPRQFLDRLPGFDDDSSLCMISALVLNAMRPASFVSVVDRHPWHAGITMLSPHCILRSYWIFDSTLIHSPLPTSPTSRSATAFTFSTASQSASMSPTRESQDSKANPGHMVEHIFQQYWRPSKIHELQVVVRDIPRDDVVTIQFLTSINQYATSMAEVRGKAEKSKLIPLYHYTSLSSAQMILRSGFRMSTQGQGDGGVYVSTQSPASYYYGTIDYESNIIRDCFGLERLEEYEGEGLLNVVIVYGCEADIFEQTPGGRENAKMVSKSTFRSFSFPHRDGNYFLRSDRILGCFEVDDNILPARDALSERQLQIERDFDERAAEKLKWAEEKLAANVNRINKVVTILRPVSLPTQEEVNAQGRRATMSRRTRSKSSLRSSQRLSISRLAEGFAHGNRSSFRSQSPPHTNTTPNGYAAGSSMDAATGMPTPKKSTTFGSRSQRFSMNQVVPMEMIPKKLFSKSRSMHDIDV